MSRWIDVDEVPEQIRKKLGIKSLDYLLEAERQIIVDVIQSAPSIDIVRCRECKYGLKTNFIRDPYLLCKKWSDIDNARTVKPDDFCSYGCRKEELNGSERLVKGSEKTEQLNLFPKHRLTDTQAHR